MSFLLSRNAAKCTLGSPSAKAVLRCLCDYADDDGTNCRPSTETISLETELDRRTVFKAVSFLSSNEWLKVFNAGRGSRNFYALNVQKINNGFEQAKVTKEVFKSESGIKFDTSNENATSDKKDTKSSGKNDTRYKNDTSNNNVTRSSNKNVTSNENATSDKKDTKSSGKNDTRYKNDTSNNNVTRSSNKNVTSNENATSDKNVSGVVTFLQESGSKNDTQLYQDYTNTKSNIDARSEPVEVELPLVEVSEVVETAPASSKPKAEKKPRSTDKATKSKDDVIKPDDVREALWNDFSKQLNARGKPITYSYIGLLRKQAKNAGWTLEEIIEEIVLRGSTYVKAEWLTPKDRTAVWIKAEDYLPELPPVEYATTARDRFDQIMAKSTYAYDIKDLSQLERVVKKGDK